MLEKIFQGKSKRRKILQNFRKLRSSFIKILYPVSFLLMNDNWQIFYDLKFWRQFLFPDFPLNKDLYPKVTELSLPPHYPCVASCVMMILIKKSLIRVPVEMILVFINLHIVEKIRQLIEAKCFCGWGSNVCCLPNCQRHWFLSWVEMSNILKSLPTQC